MKVGLVTAPRRFELVDRSEPTAEGPWAVVDVALCGICGTDVHGFLGSHPYNPAICGHEWSGTVSAVGDGADDLIVGDRVVGAVAAPCGRCPECAAGRPQLCGPSFAGMVGVGPTASEHGAFAPRLAVHTSRLVRIPDSVDDAAGAQVEPLTIVVHALGRSPVTAGDTVAVLGAGPIGLFAVQCALAAGAGHVIVVEPLPHRRALALALGAHGAVSPDDAGVRSSAADLVIECAGVPGTVQAAIDAVRRGGTVNLVGMASGPATVVPASWLLKEVTVVASLGYRRDEFQVAIDLFASGRVRPVDDRTIGLATLPEEMTRLADDPASAVKVLVDPSTMA